MAKKNIFDRADEAVNGLFQELDDLISGKVFDVKEEKETVNGPDNSDDNAADRKQSKPLDSFAAKKGKEVVRRTSGSGGNAAGRMAEDESPAIENDKSDDKSDKSDAK